VRDHLVQVDAIQCLGEGRVDERALRDGLQDRSHPDRIGGGDQVDRRAQHGRRSDCGAALQQMDQLLGVEVGQARPQRDVRIGRLLCLHADQVLHHPLGWQLYPLQQHLPRQERPIQCPLAEDGCHETDNAACPRPSAPRRNCASLAWKRPMRSMP
jgi:hypothetical protein